MESKSNKSSFRASQEVQCTTIIAQRVDREVRCSQYPLASWGILSTSSNIVDPANNPRTCVHVGEGKVLLETRPDLGISLRSSMDFCPSRIASSIAVLRVTTSSWRLFPSLSNFLLPRLVINSSIKILINALQPVYDPKVLHLSIKAFLLWAKSSKERDIPPNL